VVPLRASWRGIDDVPVRFVNQFLVSTGLSSADGTPDGVYLALGHTAPPILLGTRDEMRAQLASHEGRLDVTVHGRYVVPRARLEELIEILRTALEKYDRAVQGFEQPKAVEEAAES
jgi:hypothetical protein